MWFQTTVCERKSVPVPGSVYLQSWYTQQLILRSKNILIRCTENKVVSQEDEVWLECPTGIWQDLQRDDDEREAGEDTTFRGKLSIKVTWPQTAEIDVKQEVFQIGGCSTVVDWDPCYITSNHSLRSRRCSLMLSRSSLISSKRRSETCRKFNVQIQNSTKQQIQNQREFITRHPFITNVNEYENIFYLRIAFTQNLYVLKK